MNHDDNHSNLQPLSDPELEARIVAWVTGEASAFETAELERLIAEKPELAIFKRRIEAVHGLVGEAVRPDKAPLQISSERRAKLLNALGASEIKANPAPSVVSAPSFESTKKSQRRDRQWLLAIAASLTVGLFTVLTFPELQHSYESKFSLSIPESEQVQREETVKVELPAFGEEIESPDLRKRIGGLDAKFKNEPKPLLQSARMRGGVALPAPPPPAASLRVPYDSYNSPSKFGAKTPRQSFSVPTEKAEGASRSYLPASELGDDKLALSPFTVTAPPDAGYAASNTLAGSRLAIRMALLDTDAEYARDDRFKDESNLRNSKTGALDSVQGLFEKGTVIRKPAVADGYILSKYPAGKELKKSDHDKGSEDLPLPSPARNFAPIATPEEVNASKEPVSTFSLHVSDVSFRLAQAALANHEAIDPTRIRPEEFYNAFSYGDPTPTLAEKVSCRVEQAAHPFLQQRNLVRISTKVAAAGRDAAQPLRLTVLLDTSGSMEREDRAAIVRRAMSTLASLLGRNDRLTLIGFARQPSLLAESVAGDQVGEALNILTHLPAEGGTNLEEALKLGGELALRQFETTAQNRIVLLTDGAANLGNANPGQLATAIETLRQQGIAFDACGVGLEGLDDAMLENLTRKGDGRYYVLNSLEAADAGFAQQLAGAFRPAAENVKLQVRFNPSRVGNYRLIGFEQHRLREEDFRNDSVDAAELAAEEAAVAVYQIETLPQGEGELGEVYVRFRDAKSKNMVERSWTLTYDPQSPALDRATPSMQLAGTAALLAEKLRGGQTGEAIKLSELAPVVAKLRSHFANEPRVQELVTMFEQVRRLSGE